MKFVAPIDQDRRIEGVITAPPSKSMMQRAIAASMLASGESEIRNPTFCDDSLAALGVAEAAGGTVRRGKESVIITGGGGGKLRDPVFDCGESGLCIRMFAPIAALFDQPIILTGRGSLFDRPVGMIEATLNKLGARCSTNNGFPPIQVQGPLLGGEGWVDGSISSQVLTGLLMALPKCAHDSELTVHDLKSKPYIEMTVEVLRAFGIGIERDEKFEHFHIPGNQHFTPRAFTVEGDWSGAAFPAVLGAIGGRLKLTGLNSRSAQPDRAIIEVLEQAGAAVTIGEDWLTVERGNLTAFEFDATDSPDLFPPLVALACNCEGTSTIYGAERLKYKESDRAATLTSEFRRLGAGIQCFPDRLEIRGKTLKGGTVTSHSDHRITMACAVAAVNSETGVRIENWSAVAKSYPTFFDDIASVGVRHS